MTIRNKEREAEVTAQKQEEYDAIQAAKANGFMDCRDIRDALGWNKPRPDGSYYSATGVAYRWIEDADEEVVYVLEEDGRRITSLTYRSGCWATDFPHILEVKEAYYADIAARERKSWDDAQAAKDAFDQQKAEELAALILQQEAARRERVAERTAYHAQMDAARDEEVQRLILEAEAEEVAEAAQIMTPERKEQVMAKLWGYVEEGLRLNKNGLPPRNALNTYAGFNIAGWEKRECWPEVRAL